MPNVNVNYNANQNPPMSFAPDNGRVEMKSSGTITFLKDNAFTYTNFTTTPQNTDFTWTLDPAGNMIVTDNHADLGTYEYCVTISVNGTPISSDPQIINKS